MPPSGKYATDPAYDPSQYDEYGNYIGPPPVEGAVPVDQAAAAPVPASTSEATYDPNYTAYTVQPVETATLAPPPDPAATAPVAAPAPAPAPYVSPTTDTYQAGANFVDGNGNTGYVAVAPEAAPAPAPTSSYNMVDAAAAVSPAPPPPQPSSLNMAEASQAFSPPITSGSAPATYNVANPGYAVDYSATAPLAAPTSTLPPRPTDQSAAIDWLAMTDTFNPPETNAGQRFAPTRPASISSMWDPNARWGQAGVTTQDVGQSGQGLANTLMALGDTTPRTEGMTRIGIGDIANLPGEFGSPLGRPYTLPGEAGQFVDVLTSKGRVSPTTQKTRFHADAEGNPTRPYNPIRPKSPPATIPDPGKASLKTPPQPVIHPEDYAPSSGFGSIWGDDLAGALLTGAEKRGVPPADAAATVPVSPPPQRTTATEPMSREQMYALEDQVDELVSQGRYAEAARVGDQLVVDDAGTRYYPDGRIVPRAQPAGAKPLPVEGPITNVKTGRPITNGDRSLLNQYIATGDDISAKNLTGMTTDQLAGIAPAPKPLGRPVGEGNVQKVGVPIPGTTRARTAVEGITPAPTTVPRPVPKTAPVEPSYIQEINAPTGKTYMAVEGGKTTGPTFSNDRDAASYLQGRKTGAPEVRPAPEAAVPEVVRPNWRETGYRSQEELDAAKARFPTAGPYSGRVEINPDRPPTIRQRVGNDAGQFARQVPAIAGAAGAGVLGFMGLANGLGENVEGRQIADRRAALDAQGQDAQQYFGQRTGSNIATLMTPEQEAALRQFYGMPAFDPAQPGGHAGQNFPYPFSPAPQGPLDRVNALKDNTAVGAAVGPWLNERGINADSLPTADFLAPVGTAVQGGLPPISLPGLNLPAIDPRQAVDSVRQVVQGTPQTNLPDFPPGVGIGTVGIAPNVDTITSKNPDGSINVHGAINEQGQYESFDILTRDETKQRLAQIEAAKNPATAPVGTPTRDPDNLLPIPTAQESVSPGPPSTSTSPPPPPPPASASSKSVLPLAGPADMTTEDELTPVKDKSGKDTGIKVDSKGGVYDDSGTYHGSYDKSGTYHKSYGGYSNGGYSGSSRYSSKRKSSRRGSGSSFGGGMWEGFPFNRPNSAIRQLVLDAIAASQAKGKRKSKGKGK